MPMLTGPQLGQLADAMREVFDPASLAIFTRTTLDRRLVDYAMGDNFKTVVFDLLDAANMEGWISELAEKAVIERPQSQKLKDSAAPALKSVAGPDMKPEMPVNAKGAMALEKIVDQNSSFADVEAFLDRFQRLRDAVCRVEVPGGGGTGLLVGPNLVMTNYHVVTRVIGGMVQVGSLNCIFGHRRNAQTGAIEPGEAFAVDPSWKLIYRSYSKGDTTNPPTEPGASELDYAILRLVKTAAATPLEAAAPGTRGYLPLAQAAVLGANKPVLILQHPQPQAGVAQLPLQLAMGTTLDSPWESKRMRYDTSTLPGSSGSPCCNADLQLVALHHAGDPASELPRFNQGIPFGAIASDLAGRQAEFAAQGVHPFWT